jgi:DNA repair and recombination protein RAD52
MAGAFSGHLLNAYYTLNQNRPAFAAFGQNVQSSQLAVHGPMSFLPAMHGSFREQPSFLDPHPSFMELSEATAAKIAQLQTKLDQKLGPEYISQRPGPGGGPKLTYAEGWKIINLANEIFGFNGWSSSVVNLNVDFIDQSEESKRFTVGVTAIVRVTLRDGVFHEDIGYGMLENAKSKGQALDKVSSIRDICCLPISNCI